MNPKVDIFLDKVRQWQSELEKLRSIVLECGLNEELKWGVPCYTFDKSNIVLIHGFKDYCALLFNKGALLQDAKGILIQQTENVQAGRQMRFTNLQEIVETIPTIKAYIFEAIEVEKAGLKISFKTTSAYSIPVEFQLKLDQDPQLKTAFEALTPGRKRGYLLHFSQAKQAKTRESRIDNYIPRILKGKGFHDCVCGLSKKMPTCDGSHKNLR